MLCCVLTWLLMRQGDEALYGQLNQSSRPLRVQALLNTLKQRIIHVHAQFHISSCREFCYKWLTKCLSSVLRPSCRGC